MAIDSKKHTVPAAGEAPRRSTINDLASSINDIVYTGSATEAAQIVAAVGPSLTRPLWLWRGDLTSARSLRFSIGGVPMPIGGREYASIPGGSASGLTSANIITYTVSPPGYPYRVILDGNLRVDLTAPADYAVVLRKAPQAQLATSATDIDIHELRTSGGTARVHAVVEVPTNVGQDFGVYLQRTSGSGTATVTATAAVNRLDLIIEPL